MKSAYINKPRNNAINIITFLIIFLNSSFTVTNDIISSSATIAMWLSLFVWMIIKKIKIDGNLLVVTAVLATLILLSVPINGELIYHPLTYTFSLVVALVYVFLYCYEDSKDAYINVMYILALISLVGLLICITVPSIGDLITVQNKAGYKYTYWVLFVKNAHTIRNSGMFWEPGAFQTFLNLALLFEALSEKPDKKRIAIFVITILTTFSTTGYIALMIIAGIMLFNRNIENKSIRRLIIAMVFMIPLFMVGCEYFYPEIIDNVFGKVNTFIDNGIYIEGNHNNSSASIRYYALVKPLEVFFQHPIFGVGYEGLRNELYFYTRGMNTCTFVNWFAMYGIFYGLIMFIGFFKFSSQIAPNNMTKILVFFFLFVITMSENYVNVPVFFVIAFYGLKTLKENERQGEVNENIMVN